MPIRKIPKNYLSATGVFSSRKNGRSLGYESLLERDLMILLEFDDAVESFEEQPVRIRFETQGKSRPPYVPDILIHYFPTSTGEPRRPVLGEVKHSTDLEKHREKYAAKFEAADRYSVDHGWEWHVFTEKEIRTPYLENLKFLREYHNVEPTLPLQHEVIRHLQRAQDALTVESLFRGLCQTDERTLLIAPVVWHMVATKRIVTDLREALSGKSLVSLSSEIGQ